ncbi:MAG: hypothetical protein M0P71_16210 [Melioribacteraceae bacterium]|jgi:hypothetical protein|nr:hypothetical protein [Melioribacteraceae bacterium]
MGRPKKNQQDSTKAFSEPKTAQTIKLDTDTDKIPKLDDLKTEYQETAETKTRKPRTSKKELLEAEKKQAEFSASITGIGSMLMDIIVERMPINKPLSDMEKSQINLSFDNLANKYAPMLGRFQEETAFLMVMVAVVMPRMDLFKKKEKKKPEIEPLPETKFPVE